MSATDTSEWFARWRRRQSSQILLPPVLAALMQLPLTDQDGDGFGDETFLGLHAGLQLSAFGLDALLPLVLAPLRFGEHIIQLALPRRLLGRELLRRGQHARTKLGQVR